MKKHKERWLVLGSIFALILVAAGYFFQVQAFLPHQRIQIILPFDSKHDAGMTLIPMGETIFHPKPQVPKGHPGIDFGSRVDYQVISSSDGTVTRLTHGSSDGIDVYVSSGVYNLVYKEMDESKLAVKKGQKVKKGEAIGYPNPKMGGDGSYHYQVHWEFASASVLLDRFCPINFFTPESKTRIEAIWANVKPTDFNNMKQKFPNICSGDYAGAEELDKP